MVDDRLGPSRTLYGANRIECVRGLISGYPDMSEFRFDGEDAGAIVAYLKSIQEH